MARPACLLALALALLACHAADGARLLKVQVQAASSASATGQGAAWAASSASSAAGEQAAGRWGDGAAAQTPQLVA